MRFSLLIILCLITSCTKFGRTVTVKGRVINPITGAGIQDAEMILQRGRAGLPGGNKTVKNVHTDAEATSIT